MSAGDRLSIQDMLVRAALILSSDLSLPATLQSIVELAAEVADATYGALGVVAPDRQIQEFVTTGITDEQRHAIGHLPTGRGVLGVLITDAKPLRLERIQDHPQSVGFPPNHPRMISFLGVPIAIRGRVFGNLYLTEKRGAKEFSEEDEEAIVRLAAQAAFAIENARLYHDAQVAQRRLEAIGEINQAILAGKAPDDVLRLIAGRARELVGAAVASIVTPMPGDTDLVVRVAEGDRADLLEATTFAADGSISDDVMKTGEGRVIADVSSDPHLQQPMVKMGGVGPALYVPLAVRDRVFGTLSLANRAGGRAFSEEDSALLKTFAAQAAVALEQARIQNELQRLALVEDRERIAKELHDDVIQSLFAEGMALQASLAIVNDPVAMEARLVQAVENLDRVIRDLRNYIFGLRPGVAADRQLDRSLRDLAASFAEGSHVDIAVYTEESAVSRLAGRASDVLSAAREAISNAVRHSGCDRVTVTLTSAGEAALLEIADDGKGFEPAQAVGAGHGLSNLQDRAEALGGDLEIESEPTRGTWVRLRIPI
jgi:two-component system, NarL family, sensor histidine kinase DevS